MERTIEYEERPWRVWVNPALAEGGADSGLELVFTGADGQQVRHPIGPALLRVLTRDALELDEALLRQALTEALEMDETAEEK